MIDFPECEQYEGRLKAICRGEVLNSEKTAKWRSNRGLDDNRITGLGDVIHAIAHATGLDKLANRVSKAFGKKDCGCAKRRKRLNDAFPL